MRFARRAGAPACRVNKGQPFGSPFLFILDSGLAKHSPLSRPNSKDMFLAASFLHMVGQIFSVTPDPAANSNPNVYLAFHLMVLRQKNSLSSSRFSSALLVLRIAPVAVISMNGSGFSAVEPNLQLISNEHSSKVKLNLVSRSHKFGLLLLEYASGWPYRPDSW